MLGAGFLAVLGLIMISVYMRTRAPKRLAVINGTLGLVSLAAVQLLTVGQVSFTAGSVGLSAILGASGTALYFFLEHFFS